MLKKFNQYYLLALVVLSILIFLAETTIAQAQISNSQVILTWQANNFYPANYQGKALATPNSPVSVTAEVVKNSNLLDLSQANFTWYVNEKFLTSGRGVKEIVFPVKKLGGDDYFIRVKIELRNEQFETSIHIPIASQTIVLESPYPKQRVPAQNRIALEAVPYFFNVPSIKDLTFSWRVNSKDLSGDNNSRLTLNIATPFTEDQRTIRITNSVQNRLNPLEFARTNLNLIVD